MRTVIKIIAVLVLAPLALGVLLILTIAAIVGIPMLWEQLIAKISAPPEPPLGAS